MKTRPLPVRCVRCQSHQVVQGHINADESSAWFIPNHLKRRPFLSEFFGTPTAQILANGDIAFACLKCGLLWKTQDEHDIKQICDKWGDETLQNLMEENKRLDEENEMAT